MSKTKEHYHEQIVEGLRQRKENEEKELQKKAEEQKFLSVYLKTGTYPF